MKLVRTANKLALNISQNEWQQIGRRSGWLKSADKEELEEKSGIDFDHDEEKGECPEHAKAVHKKHKEMLDFFEKRKEGARKIAVSAEEKGGPSVLTAWHFQAKAKPYEEVLAGIKDNKEEGYFTSKRDALVAKLKGDLKQKDFQQIMGELEVWGEAIAQLFN